MTKQSTFPASWGCVLALILCAEALAAPVGLKVVDKTDGTATDLGLVVCNVQVEFDSAVDNLLIIGFSSISTSDPAGFFQDPFGGDKAPNAMICGMFPQTCIDSFVTIGLKLNTGNDTTALDGDWDSTLFNTAGATTGGWFNASPDNDQGHPDADMRVLIAQFTVHQGFNVSGDLIVYFNDGSILFPASFDCFGAEPAPCDKDPFICVDPETCTSDLCAPADPTADKNGCIHPPVDCNDGEACTLDSCNSATGCVYEPVKCRLGQICVNGVCQTVGKCDGPEDCDDGDACTTDSCAAGQCLHGPVDCDDDNVCTQDACADGVCVNTLTCDDGNPCTTDGCIPTSGCTHEPNSDPCDDGQPCTTNDICSGGTCVGGPPLDCSDGNPCTDDFCKFSPNPCFHVNNSDPCDDGLFCNGSDTCGGGTCSLHAGDPCAGADACNNCCNEAVDNCFCPAGIICSDCGIAGCGPCDLPDSCNGSGACVQNSEPNGLPCTDDGNECTNDICQNGICTHPNAPAGTPCGIVDGDCDEPDTCNGNGICLPNAAPNGYPCNDGVFCNGADTCSGGLCTNHAGDPCSGGAPCNNCCNEAADSCICFPGTLCGGDDHNPCSNPDTCDFWGVCQPNDKPNGASCDNDGNLCTSDVCQNAICTHPNAPAGTLCGSAMDTDCDDPDTCDGIGVCQPNNATDGMICDDGLFCNGMDTCDGGTCSVHTGDPCAGSPCFFCCDEVADNCMGCIPEGCGDPTHTDCDLPDTCDGSGNCQTNHLPNGTACTDDGNPCTNDFCQNGVCGHPIAPAGSQCGNPAGSQCDNPDTCNGSGNCQPNNKTGPCNDGDACTTGDSCQAGNCTSGDPTDCNDGVTCTHDACDPVLGCRFTADNEACDDGIACTDDACDPAQGCKFTPNDANCGDANACTIDRCTVPGGCVHEPLDCDDEDNCTIDDCVNGACSNTPLVCPPGTSCVDGECVPSLVQASMNIKQGACPAPVNPGSNGLVQMLLVGESDFDAATAIPSSLQLRRCDGAGGFVTPVPQHTKVKDLNHPFLGPVSCNGGCACGANQSSDGIDDLSMKFQASDMAAAGLLAGPSGAIITLELTGVLENGTEFFARDCVRIVP